MLYLHLILIFCRPFWTYRIQRFSHFYAEFDNQSLKRLLVIKRRKLNGLRQSLEKSIERNYASLARATCLRSILSSLRRSQLTLMNGRISVYIYILVFCIKRTINIQNFVIYLCHFRFIAATRTWSKISNYVFTYYFTKNNSMLLMYIGKICTDYYLLRSAHVMFIISSFPIL